MFSCEILRNFYEHLFTEHLQILFFPLAICHYSFSFCLFSLLVYYFLCFCKPQFSLPSPPLLPPFILTGNVLLEAVGIQIFLAKQKCNLPLSQKRPIIHVSLGPTCTSDLKSFCFCSPSKVFCRKKN